MTSFLSLFLCGGCCKTAEGAEAFYNVERLRTPPTPAVLLGTPGG